MRSKLLCSALTWLMWTSCTGRDGAPVTVRDAWVREPPGGHPIAAAYMVLENASDQAVALVDAQSPVAERVEIHTMSHENGTMSMRQVEQVLVPARGSAALQSGGLHLMLIGMEKAPRHGDQVELTLRFGDGTERSVQAAVRRGGYGD